MESPWDWETKVCSNGPGLGRNLEYYQICSKDDPGLTLTYFTARSNLAPYAFVWEKSAVIEEKKFKT